MCVSIHVNVYTFSVSVSCVCVCLHAQVNTHGGWQMTTLDIIIQAISTFIWQECSLVWRSPNRLPWPARKFRELPDSLSLALIYKHTPPPWAFPYEFWESGSYICKANILPTELSSLFQISHILSIMFMITS